MGYTHHDAISITGSGGIAVGSATAGETVIVTQGGVHQTSLGTSLLGVVPVAVTLTGAGTTAYASAPIAGNVTGYANYAVSTGTGRAISVSTGSAGADLCATGAVGVQGLIGASVTMTASSGGNTVTEGQVISVAMATCATAQTGRNVVTIIFTPTA